MNAAEWQKINSVVADALGLAENERDGYVAGAELSESEMREVRSLLSLSEDSSTLLETPAAEFTRDFFEDPAEDPLTGQKIGAFTILRELGHGGMGAVYLASRKVGETEQRVALKLLKREMNSSVFRQRFGQEREILASLNHPNISSLVDTGTTEDGTPYFAMEFVDGLPIDEFCASNNYDREARIELFQKVCSAVSAAHRSLIVHRDLKPSNILVTPDGTPKLLDFGISKILNSAADPTLAATVTRLGAMTPGYASPEQLSSQSVTTATDIYSLGVILFELLSGHRPFEDKEKDIGKILRAVVEDDPPAPSAKADDRRGPEGKPAVISPSGSEIPGRTHSGPLDKSTAPDASHEARPFSALRPQEIPSDLDSIVLKALQKEPDRRYLTADAFNEDLDRFLEGRPIVARPNTVTYRAGKFFRRNRAVTVIAAALIIAVLVGLIATLLQERKARAERARAEARFNDVRALANSLLFEITPAIERLPGSTPAKALLVQTALEYLNKLSSEGTTDPELLREIAAAYQKVADVQGSPVNANIGDLKGSLESYRKALDIREKLLKDSPDDLGLQSAIATNIQEIGTLESFGGEYANSAAKLDHAVELHEKVLAADPENRDFRKKLASAIDARGSLYLYDGQNATAITQFTRALGLYRELLDKEPNDDEIAGDYYYIFVHIGEAQGWDNQFDAALESIQKSIEPLRLIAERHPADQSMQRTLLLAYSKLGVAYEDSEKFELAIDAYAKALELAKTAAQVDPANQTAKRDLALAYKRLGQGEENGGKLERSLASIQNAIAVFTQLSDADPNNWEAKYDVANTIFSLGMTYASMKRYDDAIKTYNSSLEGYKKVLEVNPTYTYARRMSTVNRLELAKVYDAVPGAKDKASENYRLALDGFHSLKADGKLEQVDNETVSDLEKKVAAF